MKIPPFLAHLRTDDRGRPVPYINRWGPEDARRLTIADDPNVADQPAFFDNDQHELAPDFTAQNMQRQRECMAQGLCQVCGRPVPWSRRFVVVSSISIDRIDVAGRPAVALTEPWLDEQCATFATRVCPGLIRRRTADDLQLVEVTSKRQCVLTVSHGWIEGPLEARSKLILPAMWAKLILLELQPRPATRPPALTREAAIA